MRYLLLIIGLAILLSAPAISEEEQLKLDEISDAYKDELIDLVTKIISTLSISKDYRITVSDSDELFEFHVYYNEIDKDYIIGKVNLTSSSIQKLFNELSIVISKRESIKRKDKQFDIRKRKPMLVNFYNVGVVAPQNGTNIQQLTPLEGEESIQNILECSLNIIFGKNNYQLEVIDSESALEYQILPEYTKNILDRDGFNNIEVAIKNLVGALSLSIQIQDSKNIGVEFEMKNSKRHFVKFY